MESRGYKHVMGGKEWLGDKAGPTMAQGAPVLTVVFSQLLLELAQLAACRVQFPLRLRMLLLHSRSLCRGQTEEGPQGTAHAEGQCRGRGHEDRIALVN